METLFKIKEKLKRSSLMITCYEEICAWVVKTIYSISPVILYKFLFRKKMGKWPNLNKPESFDEKLGWLMLYWLDPLKTKCGDKYTLRSYVEEKGLGHILPKLLGVYENSNEIDFITLPERFVLKCTHGCGFNIVCKDKSILNIEEAKQQLSKWLKTDFSKVYGEIHYAKMQPRIICESFLDDLSADLPCDYKVYCFYGKVHCTMACTGRMLNGKANYDLYDIKWENKLPYSKTSLIAGRNIPKPAAYDEMISAAKLLSKPFPFVRMDFYSIKGRAVLGEMTFTPAGCIDPGYTDCAQRELGKLINLPQKYK